MTRLSFRIALALAFSLTVRAAFAEPDVSLPVVSTVTPAMRELVERTLVSGTLVPRDEVLVAPEVDGLRVTEVLAEEGDHVAKGQVLARLSREMVDVAVAQNTAAVDRARAAVIQAQSTIDQAEASAVEAKLGLDRAQSLSRSGNATDAVLEQRVSASKSADGRLAASRSGLGIAKADLAQAQAQRDELDLRLARTEVRAPVDGIVSRRSARIGATASVAGEPLFRMIAHGTVELEGEVTEFGLGRLGVGAAASVDVGGSATVTGRVRAIYPEVDRATRLGKVRITLDPDPALHIGAFARGTVEVARRRGVAVPLSALQYGEGGGTSVFVVTDGHVAERKVRTGLTADGYVELVDGVAAGDTVVARAGSFLREGDAVRIAPATDAASAKL